jgi:hypothetical protein
MYKFCELLEMGAVVEQPVVFVVAQRCLVGVEVGRTVAEFVVGWE